MQELPGPVEWEGECVKLVEYFAHKKGPNFPKNSRGSASYRRAPNRQISEVFVHQTAGASRDGQAAVDRLANWITRGPKHGIVNGKRRRIGGGRGFPGVPYTFVVPTSPQLHGGKYVVYRCWSDEWATWHTKGHSLTGVGVAFAGSFESRHARAFSSRAVREPKVMAMEAGQELILEYLLPRYGLKVDALRGHFDAGKAACPGDALEAWIRRTRGESVSWWGVAEKFGPVDQRPLASDEHRAEAMTVIGIEVGDDSDDYRMAVEIFQESAGLVIDGLWGPMTEAAIRRALAEFLVC